jgi:hypothetical protein
VLALQKSGQRGEPNSAGWLNVPVIDIMPSWHHEPYMLPTCCRSWQHRLQPPPGLAACSSTCQLPKQKLPACSCSLQPARRRASGCSGSSPPGRPRAPGCGAPTPASVRVQCAPPDRPGLRQGHAEGKLHSSSPCRSCGRW